LVLSFKAGRRSVVAKADMDMGFLSDARSDRLMSEMTY
jgi:hypothetical protein